MIVVVVLRVLVGVLIGVAGVIKYREGREQLRLSIAAFKVLPTKLLTATTCLLPPVELAVGVGIIANLGWFWTVSGLGLLTTYTAAIVSALIRGIVNDCGCFGAVLRQRSSPTLVARNLLFIVMLAPSLWQEPRSYSEAWSLAIVAGVVALAGWRLAEAKRGKTAALVP